MDSNRLPIGVFDSGLGGLTAVSELEKLMPNENIIYFGDNARIPYGTKSPEVISRFALQDARFLVSKGVKAILVACGTVSSNCLPLLRSSFGIPVVGVVEATARRACLEAEKGNKKIAVLGTNATVKSGAYEKAIARLGDFCTVSRACPLFVPLVENGHTSPEDRAANAVAEEYLSDIREFAPDALVLGCTHYPLLAPVISRHVPGAEIVSSGKEAARELYELLEKNHLTTPDTDKGRTLFFTSDDESLFAGDAQRFLGRDVKDGVFFADIEKY